MTAFANHFLFEFKTGLRSSSQLLMNYLFPLAFYAMMGLVMTQINPTFRELMIPALVIFTGLSSGVLGLPTPLVESREAGIYRSFRVNGVPALSIVVIPIVTTAVHVIIVSFIIAVTGPVLFDGPAPVNWLHFAWITVLVAFVLGSIGAVIGVIATNSRSVVLLSQAIFLPSMLLGGLMIPVSTLPESVQPVSLLLPSSHGMQAFMGLAYQQATVIPATTSALLLFASGVIAFGLAIYLFNWDSRNTSRRAHPLLALLIWLPYLIGLFIR